MATNAVGSEMLRISGGRYGEQRMLRIVVANSATNAVATNAVWYAQ
jgi:hypothetical protein